MTVEIVTTVVSAVVHCDRCPATIEVLMPTHSWAKRVSDQAYLAATRMGWRRSQWPDAWDNELRCWRTVKEGYPNLDLCPRCSAQWNRERRKVQGTTIEDAAAERNRVWNEWEERWVRPHPWPSEE